MCWVIHMRLGKCIIFIFLCAADKYLVIMPAPLGSCAGLVSLHSWDCCQIQDAMPTHVPVSSVVIAVIDSGK